MVRKDHSYLFTTYREHYMLRRALKVYLNQEDDAKKRQDAIQYVKYLDKRIAYLQDKMDGRLKIVDGKKEKFAQWIVRVNQEAREGGTVPPWEREV